MATHSGVLAWRIPGTGEPGGLLSLGSHRVRHDWSDLAAAVSLLLCQQIWKTQQWPQDWKRSVFIPIPKKGNAQECSNYHTIALISHTGEGNSNPLQYSCLENHMDGGAWWATVCGSQRVGLSDWTELNIWKFTVHVLLKPGLENFEHYFPSVWDEGNCVAVYIHKNGNLEVTDHFLRKKLLFHYWYMQQPGWMPGELCCVKRENPQTFLFV